MVEYVRKRAVTAPVKWNHAVTITFDVITENDADNLTQAEVLAALARRVADLVEVWDKDAFWVAETFELGN